MRSKTGYNLVLLCLLGPLTASCTQINNLPRLTRADIKFRPDQSSKILAADDRLITSLHGVENRIVIYRLSRIPKYLQRAVVAIEDERFYKHDGLDFRAIVRAAVANITSGRIEEGGSTITQQYVKNVIISPREAAEQTLERKLKEAALSRQLEVRLSKREILRRYLNTVYFGNGAYGVQAASRTYFSEPVWKLGLAASATLAAIIRSPETYDPLEHPRATKARRNLVLRKMTELGWVGRARARRARHSKLRLHPLREKDRYPAAYFVDYVQRLIMFDRRFKHLGKTWRQRQQLMLRGGLRIYTTVDLEMQAQAEAAVEQILPYPRDPHGALVAIDPHNGRIRAMVGGRDFFAKRRQDPSAKTNLAVSAEPGLGPPGDGGVAPGSGRQAGSAFKVFALAAAIDRGIPLSKTYLGPDCITIPGADNGGPWRPCNYEEGSFGRISLLDATANSVNTVYAQLSEEIGRDAVVNTARRMGIRTHLEPVASAVLGTNAVNPLDMASAFGAFATNGVLHPPVAITKILDPRGKVLYRDKSRPRRVLDPTTAFIATRALQQVILRGTGAGGNIGRPAAGKTGTAQDYRDAWFVGYTPNLVASVWVGYPEGQIEMKDYCVSGAVATGDGRTREVCRDTRITVTGGSWPTDIWQAFMLRALAGVPPAPFVAPGGVVTVEIDVRNGCLASRFTPADERASATFTAETVPDETCREPGDAVEVPDVAGFSVTRASDVLEAAGFVVQRRFEPSSTSPPGRVIGQSPAGGRLTAAGATVTITVSSPPVQNVPAVVGLDAGAARARLADAGFTVRTVTEAQPSKPDAKKNRGRVWRQAPPAGAGADRGAAVTIWVNPD